MKVLNLQCAAQHSFEGWFGSEADFQSQMLAHQVQCPLCGSVQIHKLPSAPRLNLSNASAPSPLATTAPEEVVTAPMDLAAVQGVQAQMLHAVRQLLASTEDVGQRFAQEARKMHYGETQVRNIRGQASAQETAQLLEEGIDVLPLPLPDALKSTLQ
jgi:hypothetical protein